MLGPEAQLDQGPGIGDELRLPAVVGLDFGHGGDGGGVPVAAGLTGKVAGFDKRLLNLGGALVVDGALALNFGLLVCLVTALAAVGPRRVCVAQPWRGGSGRRRLSL